MAEHPVELQPRQHGDFFDQAKRNIPARTVAAHAGVDLCVDAQMLFPRLGQAARRLGDRRVADGQREAKLEAGRQLRFHPLAHQ